MKCARLVLSSIAMAAIVVASSNAALATVLVGGNVTPFDYTTWSSSTNLKIGDTASGYVTVPTGDAINVGNGYIGNQLGSTGTLTISGGTATFNDGSMSSALTVGDKGQGLLDVTSGSLSVVNLFVGQDFNSVTSSGGAGTVTISGTASVVNFGYPAWLSVGGSGSGLVSITNGATLSNAATIGVASSVSGGAVVNVDGSGSKLIGGGNTTVIGSADSPGMNGIMSITNGATAVIDGPTYVYSGGTLNVGAGSTATFSMLTPSGTLQGGGAIKTYGIRSNVDVTFDGTGTASMAFGSGGTLLLDMSSKTAGTADFPYFSWSCTF